MTHRYALPLTYICRICIWYHMITLLGRYGVTGIPDSGSVTTELLILRTPYISWLFYIGHDGLINHVTQSKRGGKNHS